MNNEFKINNNIVFEDEETKIEYQKYLDEINEYNRKVANGEKTDVDLSEITSKFKKNLMYLVLKIKKLNLMILMDS